MADGRATNSAIEPQGGDSRDRLSGRADLFGLRSFVAGSENRLADWAIRSILEHVDPAPAPGPPCYNPPRYNPMVLCGPSGVGKTHLVQGLLRAWRSTAPSGSALEITAADFYRQVAVAKRNDTLRTFRSRLCGASLLVVEDLVQLAGKRVAEEELIRLIDAMVEQKSLVVVTSERPLSQIFPLHPGLRGRLAAGLVVPISPPAQTSRLKIVHQWAALRGMPLGDPTARLLAERIDGTARDLLNGLLELQMECKLAADTSAGAGLGSPGFDRQGPSPQAARDYLDRRSSDRRPTLNQILRVTARYYSLPLARLTGPSRSQSVVTARGVAIYLSRELTTHSLQEIGRSLGGRDHTTVLHNDRKIRRLLDCDPERVIPRSNRPSPNCTDCSLDQRPNKTTEV